MPPERAVLAHHLDQHALAQAAVGDAQARQREGVADRVENGAAGQHQIGALDADAIVVGALLVAHAEQPLDDGGDVGIVHPDAVDAAAVVARQIEMDAGQRRHGARRAEQVHVAADRRRARPRTARHAARPRAPSAHRISRVTSLPPKCSASVTTPSGIDIQALIRGAASCSAGSRSIRTSSVEPPPMSNRMAPRPSGSSSGEQPITASVASVSRSITSSRMPVSAATRSRKLSALAAARQASVAISRSRLRLAVTDLVAADAQRRDGAVDRRLADGNRSRKCPRRAG